MSIFRWEMIECSARQWDSACEATEAFEIPLEIRWTEICVREYVENESRDMQKKGGLWETLKKIGSFFP